MNPDDPLADRPSRVWLHTLREQSTEILKVSRPGFWPTQLWFFLLPLGQREMFERPGFWVGAAYVCFPLGLLLYGWNDLNDFKTDAHNPRKGSWLFGGRPDAELRRVLPWIIVLVQVPFLFLFWHFIGGTRTTVFFGLVVVANGLYNFPRLGTKNWPALDLLNQTGYLTIFLLASWLCGVPHLHRPALIFSALFAMQSHLFGQMMDIDADIKADRRTTAVTIGAGRSKLLLAAMMGSEAAIAGQYFRGWEAAAFTGAGATFFFIDTLVGPQRYPLWFIRLFFVGWNLVVLTTMHFVWREGTFLLR